MTSRRKESQFYSLPFGQAVVRMYQPKSHFIQPEKILMMSRIDYSEFPKKLYLPVGQAENRIHQPSSKIHQPQDIGHHFLCTLDLVKVKSHALPLLAVQVVSGLNSTEISASCKVFHYIIESNFNNIPIIYKYPTFLRTKESLCTSDCQTITGHKR